MPRLIDANILRDDFDPEDNMEYDAIGVRYIIDSAPTIDPIRAAGGCRCGECRFRGNQSECPLLYFNQRELDEHDTSNTDFCSYGELIGGEDDG